MKKVLIFHGTHGTPNGNWFPWLQDELMMQGWQVAVPTLPTPDEQSLENWTQALEEQIPGYHDVDIIIGHSCGGAFALRLLETGDVQPEQTILVGTVIDKINHPLDDLNKTFVDHPFQWDQIKINCDDMTVFHGDNDPYVPLSQAETISEKLNAPLHIIKDGGHLSETAGYLEFPELLDVLYDA